MTYALKLQRLQEAIVLLEQVEKEHTRINHDSIEHIVIRQSINEFGDTAFKSAISITSGDSIVADTARKNLPILRAMLAFYSE